MPTLPKLSLPKVNFPQLFVIALFTGILANTFSPLRIDGSHYYLLSVFPFEVAAPRQLLPEPYVSALSITLAFLWIIIFGIALKTYRYRGLLLLVCVPTTSFLASGYHFVMAMLGLGGLVIFVMPTAPYAISIVLFGMGMIAIAGVFILRLF